MLYMQGSCTYYHTSKAIGGAHVDYCPTKQGIRSIKIHRKRAVALYRNS